MDNTITRSVNYDISILNTKYLKYKQKKVHICIYNIINSVENPFLLYLLFKYPENDILAFPNFIVKEDLLTESKQKFKNITNTHLEPEGYIMCGDDIYIFFYLKIEYKNQTLYDSHNELWWSSIYEICNSRKIMNYSIHNSVPRVFFDNSILIYLLDENKNPYIIPRIGYYGCYHTLLPYVSLLGIKQSRFSPYGNFVYFNNFKRSIKYGGWAFKGTQTEESKYIKKDKHDRYDKGGIVRFAIF